VLKTGKGSGVNTSVYLQGKDGSCMFKTHDVKSIFFQVQSGIVSVYLQDGTIHVVDMSEYPRQEVEEILRKIQEGLR
jgi:hypothetical protein